MLRVIFILNKISGLSCYHFLALVDIFKNTHLDEKIPDVSLPTLTLMFRVKFRQNVSNEVLESLCCVNAKKVLHYIWMAVFSFFHASNEIPKLWTDPLLTRDRKNIEFAAMIDSYDDLMKPLSKLFKDPWDKGNMTLHID